MGTNYYLLEDVCDCCGRDAKRTHIGKSSAGWCFALHVSESYDDEQIASLDDWRTRWAAPKSKIIDEYGQPITATEMDDAITKRSRKPRSDRQPFGYPSWEAFDAANHSVPGPNGLARAKIDGRHCVGHGDGTYDLIRGEFS